MSERFSSEFFAGNRARLRELFTGTAPIVITAAGLLQRAADSAYAFQQDANFWYLTGIDEPDVVLVMDKDKEYLILPELSDYQDIFDGGIDTLALARVSGVEDVVDHKEGWRRLKIRIKKTQHLATVGALPVYLDLYGMYTNPARRQLIRAIKAINPTIELLDLKSHLARLRMLKQPAELEVLQAAINITAVTLKEITVPARLKKYDYEYQMEADITQGFRSRGATGHAFTPIVAGGVRATTIHSITNNAALAVNDLVIIDVGAELGHYAADITRTISLSSKPSRRQQAVYAAVAEVQDFALELLKPGTIMKDYETKIEHFMGEKLRELGLIKTINREKVRRYFPHATSHFLGLDPHDAGDYELPLEPGVVLTVEPGIYIPEERLGVRLEDDVLITQRGTQVLSRKLPRRLS